MAPAPSSSSRSANACDQCRRRKVKCLGDHPCRSCRRRNVKCTFLAPGRSRYSEAYVNGLRETIRRYESQLEPPATLTPDRENPPRHASATPALLEAADPDAISPASSAPTERATGPAFELRVRSLLHSHTEHSAEHVETADLKWRSTMDLIDGGPEPADLPSEADSHRLLSLFLFYMGVNQHFVDPRAFIDTMTLLYRDEATCRAQKKTVWFIEYLLVMAMGKLMDFDTQSSKPFPGAVYFRKALRLLPPLYQLPSYGVVSVEILCLVATYLQWCDRKHDAYIYIGTAVRLAIVLGCSLRCEDQQCLPSEKAHRLRVWWTAFMLDRRLAAGLGLPVAADDRQISAELPVPAPGFLPPDAISTNVKIARVTGDIMTTLYGNAAVTQLELVRSVQSILFRLYEIGQSVPAEYAIAFASPTVAVTRTGGSLYLMLFQAIILCVRPILLQRVKDKVMASLKGASFAKATPIIDRLCYTCAESATKSLCILHALQKKDQIARFGYFDLDATFSAALTLVMIGFIDDVDFSRIPPELSRAVEVLQYLSRAGNEAAEQRLSELCQFCNHVWPGSSVPLLRQHHHHHFEAHQAPASSSQQQGSVVGHSEPTAGQSSGGFTDFDPGYDFGLDCSVEADGIYSSFSDPHLPLTGVDRLDWAEMDRVFATKKI